MSQLRKSEERGHANHGWLDSWHTFSFAEYYDPAHMGFSVLRVINEDVVAPGTGFGMHPHRDMEIVTYVLSGALRHQDSMGNGSVIVPGEVQRMSAGTGIRHSEFNDSASEPVHLLQIWIVPDVTGIAPEYEQKAFPREGKLGRWQVLASPDGREGSLTIHQDARVLATILCDNERLEYLPAPGRSRYLHVARGSTLVNGTPLSAGDAWSEAAGSLLELLGTGDAEILLFDLPAVDAG